jgi:hypothetical protein
MLKLLGLKAAIMYHVYSKRDNDEVIKQDFLWLVS